MNTYFVLKFYLKILNIFVYISFRTKRVQKTDLRIKLMNEIVKSIHLVKMYVWERPFQLKVERVRR